MSSLLKTALVWILALALPMQALAAATMLHCSHQAAPQAAAAVHEHAGHHGAAAADAGVVQGASVQHTTDAADGGKHQCSACAACVAGAALPSAVSVTPPTDAAGAMLSAPATRECSVVLAGLERPPRTPLA